MTVVRIGAPLAACVMLFCGVPSYAQQASMSFFVTSAGPGKGADLRPELDGADRHCQQLASAGRSGRKNLARLSVDAGHRGRERPRPHWQRAIRSMPKA